jgi:transposase InsO family protein
MNEEQKKQVAIFRFGVISDFVTPVKLDRGEKERLLRDKCARHWRIPMSHRTRISRTAILSWVSSYLGGGRRLEALYPKARSDRNATRALDEETSLALVRLRRQIPKATIRSLIAEARDKSLVDKEVHLAETTVWRFLKREGLLHNSGDAPVDRRKYEAELPNDTWQSDAMHGPQVLVKGKKRKVYLFAFLDDMSRLVPHAQFYPSEKLTSFLDALRQALLTRGLPRKLYVDNGSAFRSRHLAEITASLGIALIHSRPYQPQGRGKIERWFRTVRTGFLPGFRGEAIEELNEALDLWVREQYHQRVHRGTGETPLKRFASHTECLRPAPKDLEDHFRVSARRRVARDRTVSLGGRLFEAPVELIGRQLTLLYHTHDPSRIEAFLEGQSHGMLRIVDLQVNCRVRRQQDHLSLHSEPRPISGGKLSFTPRNREKSS